jgi:hypothetical protein
MDRAMDPYSVAFAAPNTTSVPGPVFERPSNLLTGAPAAPGLPIENTKPLETG